MKNIFLLFLTASIISCSSFEVQVSDIPSHEMLTIDNIDTELPVISITTDPTDFEKMIADYEEDIEIEGHFKMYRNGEKVVSKREVELEIKGNYSTQFALKSLGVKFEDKYDNSDRKLINPEIVLPYHDLDEIRAIRLRNSGNDFSLSMLKDLSYSQLAIQSGLDLDLTYGEAAIVFVNEEFYGLLNLRTESNTNGMAGLYDAKKSDVTLAKVANPHVFKKDGDFDRIDRLTNAIEYADLEYLKSEIDLNNFTDYMIFQSYIANFDWPHNNVRFYAIKDEKFRFVLFDTDFANTIQLGRSPFRFQEGTKGNVISDLTTVLYADPEFKLNYDNRYLEVLSSGKLSSTVFQSIVTKNITAIEDEIHWQISKYQEPASWVKWYVESSRLIELFKERELRLAKGFED